MMAIDRSMGASRPWTIALVLSIIAILLYSTADLLKDATPADPRGPLVAAHHATKLTTLGDLLFPAHLASRADSDTGSGGEKGQDIIDNIHVTDPDNTLTYDNSAKKGQNFEILMDTEDLSTCQEVQQSKFTKISHMSDNGWKLVRSGTPSSFSWDDDGEPDTTAKALAPLSFSNDNQKNVQYEWQQSHEVTINGKQYKPTSATFVNRFTAEGAIFAITNFSPRRYGALLNPPIKDDGLIPLQAWSDVAFLTWQEVCKGNPKCIKGLKAIVQCNILSEATEKIYTTAFGEYIPVFPGKTVQKGSKEHRALLGSPNGRGVAWMLLQHREQLGWKYAEAIQIYSYNELVYIVFHIKDNSRSSQTKARSVRLVSGRDTPTFGSVKSVTVAGEGSSELSSFERRADVSKRGVFWDSDESSESIDYVQLHDSDHSMALTAAQSKGQALTSYMQADADSECVQQSVFKDFKDLATSGWRGGRKDKPGFANTADVYVADIREALEKMHEPTDDDHNVKIEWKHDQKTTASDQKTIFYPTYAYYSNVYSQHGIIAMNIESVTTAGAKQEPPVDGKTRKFAPLKQWSDVTYLQWVDFCKTHDFESKDIRWVFQSAISNKQTQDTCREIFNEGIADMPHWPGKIFKSGTPDFNALLATPNGQGTAWFLAQHKEQLGVKMVQTIQVWAVDELSLYMIMHISDYQSSNERRSDTGESSTVGRSRRAIEYSTIDGPGGNDDRLYNSDHDMGYRDAQTKGKGLIAIMEADPDSDCVQQSEFTDYKDLAAYGWSVHSDEPAGYEESTDSSTRDLVKVLQSLGEPIDDDHNSKVNWQHNRETSSRDKKLTFRPTNAYYFNNYAQHGVVAMFLKSVKMQAKVQKPPVDVLVPLQQWSDVTWLQWTELSRTRKSDPKDFRFVIHTTISNHQTTATVKDIFGVDPGNLPGWPGKTVPNDSNEFAALLATPNGQGTAWLLAQHKDQLGVKTVRSIQVWGSGFSFSMAMHIGEYQPRTARRWNNLQGTPELDRRNRLVDDDKSFKNVSGPIAGRHVRQSRRVLAKRFDKSDFDKLVTKGKDIVAALQSSDTCMPQSDWTDYTTIDKWGWTVPKLFSKQKWPHQDDQAFKDVYGFLGAKTDLKANRWYSWRHTKKTQDIVDGKTTVYYPTNGAYDNYYNPLLIIANSNFGPASRGKDQDPPVTGKSGENPFPRLNHWSDVAYLDYSKFMADTNQPMTQLKGVWRKNIINKDTQNLIDYIMGGKEVVWPGKDFGAETDEFAALIRSQNGLGTAWLLLQHRTQFERKTITSARVFYEPRGDSSDKKANIIWVIKDLQTGSKSKARRAIAGSPELLVSEGVVSPPLNYTIDPSTWSYLDRRAALDPKKSSATDLVAEAQNSGKYLASVQAADTAMLKSCFKIDQSVFTDDTALGKHGWTSPNGAKNADFDDAIRTGHAVEDSWKAMGLGTWTGSNLKVVEWKHTDKTQGTVDGKQFTYHATQAYFKNAYGAGGIVAVNNKSPPNIGPSQNPKVDGTTNPYPPLQQWSDVAFLEYKQQCGSDGGCMKKLKGVLRYQVTNIYTKKALTEFMVTSGAIPKTAALPLPKTWPGTTYKLGEDGFNVVLGMPGGKGVGFLLAQHREQLGWKEVYEIHVFSDGAMYQILYLIRDHTNSTNGSQRRDFVVSPNSFSRDGTLKLADATPMVDDQVKKRIEAVAIGGKSETEDMSSVLVRWVGRKIKAARTALGFGRMRLF